MQYLALTTFAGVIAMNGHLVAGVQRHRLLIGRAELRVLKADRHEPHLQGVEGEEQYKVGRFYKGGQ